MNTVTTDRPTLAARICAALLLSGFLSITHAQGPLPTPIDKQLASIVPAITLDHASLKEAISFVKAKSKQLDPQGKGLAFSFLAKHEKGKLTLSMKEIPVKVLLDQLCELTGTHWTEVEGEIVVEDGPAPDPKAAPEAELALQKRLEALKLPSLNFVEASLEEAVTYLQAKLKQLEPDQPIVNFSLKLNRLGDPITLQLKDQSFYHCLQATCKAAGATLSTAGGKVKIVVPENETSEK